MATPTPAIEVSRLEVVYRPAPHRTLTAVQDLSFSVAEGEIVGFIGPNGAGKSSTLKALMGFVAPSRGTATLFGQAAGSLAARALCGYLPEVAMYYPTLSPYETLRMYGQLQGLGGRSLRSQSEQLLAAVGLSTAMHKLNKTLSKGMLQRVGIAQALLGNPKLLILDEVTSGLDPVGRRELRDVLLQRRSEGCTLFFSSHELAEVVMLCDRILLVHHGRLVEERALADVRQGLRQFAITVRGACDIGTAVSHEELGADVRRYRFKQKQDLIGAVAKAQNAGAAIIDLVSEEGDLEQYFVDRIAEAA